MQRGESIIPALGASFIQYTFTGTGTWRWCHSGIPGTLPTTITKRDELIQIPGLQVAGSQEKGRDSYINGHQTTDVL